MATPSPTLPTPNPLQHNTSPDYYYFVVSVAVVSIFLVVSNIFAFACCSPNRFVQNFQRLFHRGAIASGQSQEPIPVSKYRKDQAYDTECSVCLTGFMEGEEVRQLPVCKHSFHAPCIDMWLYSHSTCPLCRGTVSGLPPLQRCPRAPAAADVSRPRRPLFTESANMHHVVVSIM